METTQHLFNGSNFSYAPEEDLDDAKKRIKKLIAQIISEIKDIRTEKCSQKGLLEASHMLLDDLFSGYCCEKYLKELLKEESGKIEL